MTLLCLLTSFLITGAGAFGGGYTAITLIEHEAVHVHGWMTAAELSELIAVAQMTPGPIMVNAVAYTGLRVAGPWGAAAAVSGFMLPSITLCSILIWLLAKFSRVSWMDAFRKSVQPAVAGLIAAGVLAYGRGAVTDAGSAVLAVLTFVILAASRGKIHPAALILCGGVAGVFIFR